MTAPETGVDYPVKLGSTILGKRSSSTFCTLRYDFKPASLGRSKAGQLQLNGQQNKVALQLPPSSTSQGPLQFQGRHESSRDGLDAVAVFDGTSWNLELVGTLVKNLRHLRDAVTSNDAGALATASQPQQEVVAHQQESAVLPEQLQSGQLAQEPVDGVAMSKGAMGLKLNLPVGTRISRPAAQLDTSVVQQFCR
ncbi:hypothetical protein WJX72_006660 [[Myrmecia] bisecta]|uniref:Transcription elongation factor Eaf N-terminal domain-containing protein n=1 Tax=[Myrmecia] bisecta TaxID=41462 RepID=A0AAW1PPL0_9CHLO